MTKSPLVSIAVCTYNGEKYLREQLESLVNQTYTNLEIVICDDASTDTSVLIINEFAKIYPYVRYNVNSTNIGYVKNFENALSLCEGKLIVLCDQDDIWFKNKIEFMLANFEESSTLIYHDSRYVEENGKEIGLTLAQTSGYISGSNPYQVAYHNCIAGHAMMFRKELVNNLLPIPKFIPHDHWIAFVSLNIGNIQYLPKPLVYYRQHSKSITDILNQKKEKDKKLELFRRLKHRSKINEDRIHNIQAMQAYAKNTTANILFYQGLINHLKYRDNQYFSFSLFGFLFFNRRTLFNFYHKNIFSVTNKIFKESIGNKGKLLLFKLKF